MTMACRQVQGLLETFVDGELPPEQTLTVEVHLDGCADCSEHAAFLEAVNDGTRKAVLDDAVVSSEFEERLKLALTAERDREVEAERALRRTAFTPLLARGWKASVPLAIAAGFLLWWQSTSLTGSMGATSSEPEAKGVQTASLGNSADEIEQALDRLIDHHSAPPAAQVTNLELLANFDRDVGVRVHAPRLDKFGASWEGADLVKVRNSQAASLRYRMPGRRFTVYMYDPRKVSVSGNLERRMVRDHPVYVGEWRGYTVAAKENQGIGYAMASDLDDDMTAQVLTEIH